MSGESEVILNCCEQDLSTHSALRECVAMMRQLKIVADDKRVSQD